MSYSQNLRDRVIQYVRAGHSRREAARVFQVNHQTVNTWMVKPVADKPGPKGAHKIDMEALAKHVAAHNDMHLSERAAHFGVSINGIWCALRRLGVTSKKRSPAPPSKLIDEKSNSRSTK